MGKGAAWRAKSATPPPLLGDGYAAVYRNAARETSDIAECVQIQSYIWVKISTKAFPPETPRARETLTLIECMAFI